jgi:hypothetical protein
MKRHVTILIVVGVTLCTTVSMWGQVDLRVNQGNALDANPGVGSGGANTAVAPTSAMDTQLLVSGQVTGLGGFHGNVPYYQPNEFHGNLPSQMLENFNARSVSLYQAQTGIGLSQTAGYFGRSRTVVGLRGIEAGINAPGSSMIAESAVPVAAINEFRSGALQRYQSVYVQRPPGELLSDNPIQGPLTNMVVLGQSQGVGDAFAGEEVAFQPSADALLAMPWEKNRQELMDEFLDMREDRGATAQILPAEPEELDLGERVTTVDLRPESVDEDGTDEEDDGSNMGNTATIGKDAYFDLTVAMHVQSGAEMVNNPAMVRYVEEYQKNLDRSAVAYDVTTGLYVIRSLSGSSELNFNQLMSQGQVLSYRGHYYLADMKFSAAGLASSYNPFPAMGSSITMFACGEPIHAALKLKSSMVKFPPMMETRLDVSRIVPKDDFDVQLQALKDSLAEVESPEPILLLLATYMCLSDEDVTSAKEYAATLSRVAGEDIILSTYAEFVLTGNRPTGDDDE